jgi:hypothetical protein
VEFQNLPLSKTKLAELFSKLAVNGKIVPDNGESAIASEVTKSDHWEDLASKLFRSQIAPDLSFLSRASNYV